MPDLLLPRLKQEIEARLAELRPFVAEAEQLEAAKRALLDEIDQPRRARGTRPVAPAAPVPPASRRAEPRQPVAEPEPAAPERSEEETAILAVVDERPGVSVAEIVAVTKLDKGLVGSTVARLKREGVLADEALGVKLASRQPITLAAARQEGASEDEWDAAAPAPAPASRKGAAA